MGSIKWDHPHLDPKPARRATPSKRYLLLNLLQTAGAHSPVVIA